MFTITMLFSRLVVNILVTLYVYITLVYCPYLDRKWQILIENDNLALFYVAFFGFLTKMLICKRTKEYSFYSLDLNISFFKNFNSYFSTFFIKFNKVVFFKKNVIFKNFFFIFKNFINFLQQNFLFWKPLFKKSSYFSLYKSSVSRYVNK